MARAKFYVPSLIGSDSLEAHVELVDDDLSANTKPESREDEGRANSVGEIERSLGAAAQELARLEVLRTRIAEQETQNTNLSRELAEARKMASLGQEAIDELARVKRALEEREPTPRAQPSAPRPGAGGRSSLAPSPDIAQAHYKLQQTLREKQAELSRVENRSLWPMPSEPNRSASSKRLSCVLCALRPKPKARAES